METSYLEKRHLGKGEKEKEKGDCGRGKGDGTEWEATFVGAHPALCLPKHPPFIFEGTSVQDEHSTPPYCHYASEKAPTLTSTFILQPFWLHWSRLTFLSILNLLPLGLWPILLFHL